MADLDLNYATKFNSPANNYAAQPYIAPIPISTNSASDVGSGMSFSPVPDINLDITKGFQLGGTPTIGDSVGTDLANTGDGWSWLGKGDQPGVLIPGLEALSGLGQLYLGKQAIDLSRDQFGLARSQFNRELLNQGQVYNTNLEDRQRTRQLERGMDPNSPEFQTALNAYVEANKVDTSAI